MTNKEAIQILMPLTEYSVDENGIGTFPMVSTPLQAEALNLAIKALEERFKGEWIFRSGVTCGGYYKCSNCGEVERAEKNFCPNCGSDMRGEAEDENN